MRFFLCAASACLMTLTGCNFTYEPDEQLMREAYLETDDVRLGSEFLDGNLSLSEFRKVNCIEVEGGIYRCRFYAKFSVQGSGGQGQQILSQIVSSQTGYFREALFFKNSVGRLLCTDITQVSG
jgi:hypothetical protein